MGTEKLVHTNGGAASWGKYESQRTARQRRTLHDPRFRGGKVHAHIGEGAHTWSVKNSNVPPPRATAAMGCDSATETASVDVVEGREDAQVDEKNCGILFFLLCEHDPNPKHYF